MVLEGGSVDCDGEYTRAHDEAGRKLFARRSAKDRGVDAPSATLRQQCITLRGKGTKQWTWELALEGAPLPAAVIGCAASTMPRPPARGEKVASSSSARERPRSRLLPHFPPHRGRPFSMGCRRGLEHLTRAQCSASFVRAMRALAVRTSAARRRCTSLPSALRPHPLRQICLRRRRRRRSLFPSIELCARLPSVPTRHSDRRGVTSAAARRCTTQRSPTTRASSPRSRYSAAGRSQRAQPSTAGVSLLFTVTFHTNPAHKIFDFAPLIHLTDF